MQVRSDEHTSQSALLKETFETKERSRNEDIKLFFKLFEEWRGAKDEKDCQTTDQAYPEASLVSQVCFTGCTFLFTSLTRRIFRGQTVLFS
jgi:predicted translin family RNA/ssDNA-binding protein